MRWRKKTKTKLRKTYHIYIKDTQHKYDMYPKENEFVNIIITFSHPIAVILMEQELDKQYTHWFYNEFEHKYMLKDRTVIGFIREITSPI